VCVCVWVSEWVHVRVWVCVCVREREWVSEQSTEWVGAYLGMPFLQFQNMNFFIFSHTLNRNLKKIVWLAHQIWVLRSDMVQSCNKTIASLIYPVWQIFGICPVMMGGRYICSSRNCSSLQITNSVWDIIFYISVISAWNVLTLCIFNP
jgi:hypothetical protein